MINDLIPIFSIFYYLFFLKNKKVTKREYSKSHESFNQLKKGVTYKEIMYTLQTLIDSIETKKMYLLSFLLLTFDRF